MPQELWLVGGTVNIKTNVSVMCFLCVCEIVCDCA
jgi:hypothetical protein